MTSSLQPAQKNILQETYTLKQNKKKQKIEEIQNEERFGRHRAIQIMLGKDTEPTTNTKKYATIFSCIMTLEEQKILHYVVNRKVLHTRARHQTGDDKVTI